VFEGVQTGHDGFVIGADEARALLTKNQAYRAHVKPFINGTDLVSGRYVGKPEFVYSARSFLRQICRPVLVLADTKEATEHEPEAGATDWSRQEGRTDAAV
jgi:hypothetical protein